jgi:ubiquinone biosynthesis protein COQ4
MVIRSFHAARAFWTAIRIVRDPNRLNEVFNLSDELVLAASGDRKKEILSLVRGDAAGAAALRDKPRLGKVDLAALGRLPEGTLGRVFADHMLANNLDPEALPSLTGDSDLEFVRAHLYETHDIWHVVTGFATDVPGELGLQGFYLAQFPGGLPAALLAGGLVNTLVYAFDQRDARMRAIVRGWLLGKRSKPFFGVRWAELWDKPIEEVRALLHVELLAVENALPRATLQAA